MNLDEYRVQREERNQREVEEIRSAGEDFSGKKDTKKEPKKERKQRKRRSTLPILLMGVLIGTLLSLAIYGAHYFLAKQKKPSTQIVVGDSGMKSEVELGDLRENSNSELSLEDESIALGDGADSNDAESTDLPEKGEIKNYSDKESAGALATLQQSLENGDGTLKALRKAFKGQIMVVREGDFFFRPISDSLEKNNYEQSRLSLDDKGRFVYTFEDGSTSKAGIDVSKYQGVIDWEKVKNDGIDFAIIRGGIRGYESGKLVPEEDFVENALAASGQSMEIGVYFFSQAVNEEEAVEEADCVIESLSGNEISYPIIYDLERISGGRMSEMTASEMTDCALAFCNRVSEAGYTPMIYGNLETFILMLDMDRLEDIEKWFAYYGDDFYFPYKYRIWQYSEKGHVDGIEGEVDMNIAFY